ncbi:nuclear transport factor 2 family protein [Leptotrichia sp. OH3620_COT-345]|uniref:nuclear transport factor 2 family protein n=1 Tax=Leptotrichia sp. OH3620_COT-345 TaxID=2491048 RepID=UPI000F646545|nr:nuclear transport factor 2 family protein [Leptotrichia sp. OH3620_COT-345]RRD38844.1 nuclear transport factor 2 family protein [Leptotrichia sp. OH3620_COT-345]
MEEKERIIKLWFDMWLHKKDTGIDKIFSDDVIYTESWGPEYKGKEKIKLWFYEWNTRADVLKWEIKQFFHKGSQTVIEWYFKCIMKNDGKCEEFSGMSLIQWNSENKISFLKEFMCKLNNYDPYKNAVKPEFQDKGK